MTPEGALVARSALGRSWRLRRCDEGLALALSQRLGLDEITGRVLAFEPLAPPQMPLPV